MRKMIMAAAVAAGALALSACTGTAVIPPVSVDVGQGLPKIEGDYVAQIQTGGWNLKTDDDNFICSGWSFDADMNMPYHTAMQQVLTNNLEQVRFIEAPLKPSELEAQGIDAQVIVHQGNADSNFEVRTGLFSGTAISDVALEAVVAIVTPHGTSFQKTISGEGRGASTVLACNAYAEMIGAAASKAISELVEDATLYIREGVRSVKPQPVAPPTS